MGRSADSKTPPAASPNILPYLGRMREIAASRSHGDRLRYVAGCRCLPCRAANSRYEAQRQQARKAGDWNGYTSAEKARARLLQLRKQGVGYKAVAAAADVSITATAGILSGRKKKIRARTERKIMAVDVDAVADGALVKAASTWALIDKLLDAGYTKSWIALKLGSTAKQPSLQLRTDFVTARNASNVKRLYLRIQDGRITR